MLNADFGPPYYQPYFLSINNAIMYNSRLLNQDVHNSMDSQTTLLEIGLDQTCGSAWNTIRHKEG